MLEDITLDEVNAAIRRHLQYENLKIAMVTQETARLMAVGPVEASTDVMNLRAAQYFGGRAAIVASARQLLASAPQPGSNRVIVAHGNVAREATPAYPEQWASLLELAAP